MMKIGSVHVYPRETNTQSTNHKSKTAEEKQASLQVLSSIGSSFELLPESKNHRHLLPPSRLTFKGVSDKRNCHTGYFAYRLDEKGHIYCRWDPVIAPETFTISCSSRRELPINFFNPSAKKMQKRFDKLTGPYHFTYNQEDSTALVNPRQDLVDTGFVLRHGKLVPIPLQEAQSWQLHDEQGGPKLDDDKRIIEFQVDNEVIAARGSNHMLYLYKPLASKWEKLKWKNHNGFVKRGKLMFPESMRDWAFGVSSQAKPIQRRGLEFINPWVGLNSYYGQDTNKTAFGSTMTVGILPSDGRTIRFWDTGLPPDFHRGFITPEHGMFLGEKLAQAGSTWLLYGFTKEGRPGLYLRMYDYEIFGACIGMQHSFDPHQEMDDSEHIHDLGEAVRKIPLPGWQTLDFPTILGKAVITDAMSIHCSGEGDAAREIRIEGKNAKGQIGFYYRGLKDISWRFVKTDSKSLLGKPIHLDCIHEDKITNEPLAKSYTERSQWQGLAKAPIAHVDLFDFHPYQTQSEPSRLCFSLLSGKKVEVLLRTADAWSPFHRLGIEDEVVATGSGVAKILMGSLDIPEDVYESDDKEIRDFVTTYLEPYDRIANLFEVIADIDRVEISTNGRSRRDRQRLPPLQLPSFSLVCTRNAQFETRLEKKALDKQLIATPLMSALEIHKVIEANMELQKIIEQERLVLCKKAKSLGKKWRVFQALMGGINAFTTVTTSQKRPYISAVLDMMPRLIVAHKKAYHQAKEPPAGFLRAIKQIKRNIEEAEALL